MKIIKDLERDNSNLIKALQKMQEEDGYISDDAIQNIADYFEMPPVDVEGVVSFYTQFKRTEPGKYKISVCDGTACHIKGSPLVLNWISDELGIEEGETDEEKLFSLETVACLGCCSLAPVVSINGKVYGNLDRDKLMKIIEEYREKGANNDK
ncbi:MAG: NAD(P)H-dependent oxidoreductase subunit E [Bacillota bacterium]